MVYLFTILIGAFVLPVCSQAPARESGGPVPVVDIAWHGPSRVELSWAGVPDRMFSIQRSDDLVKWKTVGLGNVDSWVDEIGDARKRYYRISSNAPPVLDPIGDKRVSPGETLKFAVSANDPDGDQVFLGSSNLPEGAAFDPNSGVFSWTPVSGQEGTYASVRFSATDSGDPRLSDYEDITIVVGDVAPEIVVVWPEGGARLEAGAIDAIEWVSKGDIGNTVHIDFTPDGGETWYVVKENVPNIGYYNWIVPDSWEVPGLPSDDCWIAVWSEDESIYGLTDDAFSIYETTYVVWSIYLVAGDGQYLGDCTTNPYVWDSIWNVLGPYGSETSWTSIWNPVSIYGADYSDLSPWDPFALDPPYIFINDEYAASLTMNCLIWDAIYPEDFFDWVEEIGY